MHDALGWVASVCFIICSVPQALDCIKSKSAGTLSWSFLLLWAVAEIASILYILPTNQYPLLANYAFSCVSLSVMIFYKVVDLRRGK